MNEKDRQLGLIGKTLTHSFSKKYFTKKFFKENISCVTYSLFPLQDISDIHFLYDNYPNLLGLNVTIPYKEVIIPYLDDIDKQAMEVGAVNTIHIYKGKKIGYNTDIYGFECSLKKYITSQHKRALILGTGGASKAVAYVLKRLGVEFLYVSRQRNKNNAAVITYADLDKSIMQAHTLIVNTTPLGMSPYVASFPAIPYSFITNHHILYDLVYNPLTTLFMSKGLERNALVLNGLDMLYLQAEKSWEIWSKSLNEK